GGHGRIGGGACRGTGGGRGGDRSQGRLAAGDSRQDRRGSRRGDQPGAMKLYLLSLYRNVVAGTRLALFMPVRPYDYRAAPLDFTLLVAFNFLVWVAAAAIRTGVTGDCAAPAIPIYPGAIPPVLRTPI